MLDNSFGVFHNVTPRFQWAEIDLPFQSDDHFFRLANYDAMLASKLAPVSRMKIKDAFLLLFSPPETRERDLEILRQGQLNALDMQMLIHCTSSLPIRPLIFNHNLTSQSPLHTPLGSNIRQPPRLPAFDLHPPPPRPIQIRNERLEAPLGRNQIHFPRKRRVEQTRFPTHGGRLFRSCKRSRRGL